MWKRFPASFRDRDSKQREKCEDETGHAFEKESLVKPIYRHLTEVAYLVINEKIKAMIHSGRNVSNFVTAQSPFPIPEPFKKELIQHLNQSNHSSTKGIPELRKVICEFHRHFDDLKLDSSHILVAPGSKELLLMILSLFDGAIFLPSPSWYLYETQSVLSGNVPLTLVTDKSRWKVTPEAILAGGLSYTEKELREISECCQQNKIIILSDEVYASLTYSRKHISVAKFYPEGTILVAGFSKWAAIGGWRLGYAYIPPTLGSFYATTLQYASSSYSYASAPIQYAAAYALIKHLPELEEYIEDCCGILKIASDFCFKELSSVGVSGRPGEGGVFFMPNLEVVRSGLQKRGIITGKQMTEAILEEADVALMASEYFTRPSTDFSVRFCFVCFDGDQALTEYREKKALGVVLSQARKEEKERFLRENCKSVVDGIQRLKDWILENKN